MTTFYICRHGETENNKNHILSGWSDSPLTELGQSNAISAATKLQGIKIDKIVCRDTGRASNTATIFAIQIGYAGEIEKYKNFREMNYGDLTGKNYSEYPDLTVDENSNYIPTNGESLTQMRTRVMECVDRLNSLNSEKSILIVAHDGTINSIRSDFKGISMGQADLTHNPHDMVARFLIKDGKIISFEEVR